jgi:Raf kinase inhibitor-like YbhB/YbcL family protein
MDRKKILYILIPLFALGIFLYVYFYIGKSQNVSKGNDNPNLNSKEVTNSNMKLTTTAFKDGGKIPPKYTCDGEGINPPLEIEGIPENTKSLALIVNDSDAPIGDFTHWTIWNIDPGQQKIAEGETPRGSVQGLNDSGKKGFIGPCPPSGIHRYQFNLYALDSSLDLSADSKRKDLETAIKDHLIEKTVLTGLYGKS